MERMSSAESVVTKPVDFITEFTPAKDARLVSTFTLFPNTRLCSSFHDFIDVCQLKEYSRKMHLKSGMCGTRREESMNEDRPWTHSSLHPTVYWPWKGCWTAALLRRRRRRSSGRRREREESRTRFCIIFLSQASKQAGVRPLMSGYLTTKADTDSSLPLMLQHERSRGLSSCLLIKLTQLFLVTQRKWKKIFQ